MLAVVKRCMGVEGFQKEFSMKDAVYAVSNVWHTVPKDTLVHACHNLWPTTMFSDDVMHGNALCSFSFSRGTGSHILYLIGCTAVHNPHLWVL